ncbi:MAG: N-acetyltransferase [Lentisphaerae bacterium]|nr:N-acetyltransferase [Lentisphaerota bacterium]
MNKNDVFIHHTAEVADNASIGKNTRVWNNAQVRENSFVGQDCIIGKDVYIDLEVRIGNSVKIQNGVSVYRGVTVEDDVFLGPHMTFTNDRFPRASVSDFELYPTVVRRGASIGAHATIVCGIEIGEYAMIGAGAVVTKDIPPFALAYGNPARIHGYVAKNGEKLCFNDMGVAVTSNGEQYQINSKGIVEYVEK